MDNIFVPSIKIAKKVEQEFGTPVYLTNVETLKNRIQKMQKNFSWENTKIFYALKANYNPEILKTLKNAGLYGVDAVSPFEIELAKRSGFLPSQIIFTASNPSSEELEFAHKNGVLLNLGSLSEIERFGRLFPNTKISLRINPESGTGEDKKMNTGGRDSKFGINVSRIQKAKELIDKYKLVLVGLHFHVGSGFYEAQVFKKALEDNAKIALLFENLEFIDVGGGYGVRYKLDEKEIDLKKFSVEVTPILEKLSKEFGKTIELRLEPGKFLVAESTVLLAKITTIKTNGDKKYVGLNTGLNHLIRPSYYGSYHEIINISNPKGKKQKVDIVGNICESGDVFARERELAEPREGDLVAICTAGGYGASMGSNYNLRPLPAEVLLEKNNELKLVRKRLNFEELLNGLGYKI